MRKQEMSYRDNYDNIDWTKSNYKVIKSTKRTRSIHIISR